jgi:intein-encoded DNA endonuclease-like protein
MLSSTVTRPQLSYNRPVKVPNSYFDKSREKVIKLYSKSQFSFGSVKLVALSRVARYFQDRSKYQYLAGLWRKDLERQL